MDREVKPAMSKRVRIGCGAGFWGDTAFGARQLVDGGDINYLVMDYLAEITMAILARLKARRADAGYAVDFVDEVMPPLLEDLQARGIRVITNAGGINPQACAAALAASAAQAGYTPRIAVVVGDDLSPLTEELRASGLRDMGSGMAFPAQPSSINAYLGALPIKQALAAGADIVITGRCVDSALALGPLMHEFDWCAEDYDKLAAGSLAGHIIECGAQATGGLFTDWDEVPGWDDMGFPIADCGAAGDVIITKPPGTGGRVDAATVAEQIVYEIGDPAAYLLPDVCCDFSAIRLEQDGSDRVRVSGARGRPPGAEYKACATWQDGYRAATTVMIGGIDAAAKATRVAEAILARTRRLNAAAGFGDYDETLVEILGNESTYGPHARVENVREVILKLAVRHEHRAAVELFTREIFPAATAMAQGLTGFAGGRPQVQPVFRVFSCLVHKREVAIELIVDGERRPVDVPITVRPAPVQPTPATGSAEPLAGPSVPLVRLAHARSGDKGDSANIGVLARDPAFVPILREQLTAERVQAWFSHLAEGPTTRYEWPGLNGFNFVLERALGGGGTASLRHDPQGKAYAQMLLDLPITVPPDWGLD